MHNEISSPVVRPAAGTSASPWLRSAGIIVAGTVLLALCAHVSVPLWFTPVPLSLQPFGVLLLGLLLSPRMAATTLVAYLAEGIAGLPVFAPGLPSGPAHLLGPTGGYLMAYPVAALLISLLWRSTQRGFFSAFVSAAVGDLLILLGGSAWLAAATHRPSTSLLWASLFAFLPGDALKSAAAAGIASGWQRVARRQDRSSPTSFSSYRKDR